MQLIQEAVIASLKYLPSFSQLSVWIQVVKSLHLVNMHWIDRIYRILIRKRNLFWSCKLNKMYIFKITNTIAHCNMLNTLE